MAKIRIKGDTSGYIDIAAPAVAGSVTLNLPTSDATFMTTAGGTFTGNLELSGSGAGISFSGGGTTFIDAETSPLIFKTSGVERGRFTGAGDFQLYEDTGTTAKFFWDASLETLGIGTTSPPGGGHALTLQDGGLNLQHASGTPQIRMNDSGIGSVYIKMPDGENALTLETGGSERMRIDSNGNLLVGTTNLPTTLIGATSGGGIALDPDSYSAFNREATSSNQSIVVFNQTGVDAKYFLFRKDGTTVGSIGSRSSSHIYVALSSSGLANAGLTAGTASGSNTIFPTDSSGTTRDNGVDLGWSSGRFKDLYLSGGVYLGGTGSANYLDDYEEGTWTPTADQGVTGFTIASAIYIKVGALVHVQSYLLSFSGQSASPLKIGGLPFNPSNDAYTPGSMESTSNGRMGIVRTQINNDELVFYYPNSSNGTRENFLGNDIGDHLIFSVTYKTSS